MMSERRHVTLTREELYEKVWATPMRKLAATYCLSDVGLKKTCKAHKIPTPPVGYLAKKAAGKRVRQTPLPVLDEAKPRVISLSYDPDPKPKTPAPPSDPVTDPKLLALISSERDPANQITVPDHLRVVHPIIQKTRDALNGTPSSDRYNLVRPNYQEAHECVVMAVHKTSIMRSLRLMNTLFRELEKRGHRVEVRPPITGYSSRSNRVRCLMLGEEFGFALREKLRMVWIREEEQQGRSYRAYEKVRYEPKAELELSITVETGRTVNTWADKKSQSLESQLNRVIIGMLVAVEKCRQAREAQKREEAARLQREEERREQERIKQIERSRVEQFETLAVRWQKSMSLFAFVEAVKAETICRCGVIEEDSGIARWLTWAENHARTIDPLSGTELPSIEETGMK